MDITLLELHLDDASFNANAPFAGGSSTEESPDESAVELSEETERPGVLPFVVGLATLAVVAYLVRRWRNGGESTTEVEPEAAEPPAPTA